jgi:5,10-methenyltetrahydrofolate synthetase
MWLHKLRVNIMPQTIAQKSALRRALLANRQAIPPEVRRERDAALCAHVVAWWERQRMESLGIYWPIRGEPDLRPAYELLAGRGVKLALPVVVDKHAPLVFLEWQPGAPRRKDQFGVSIPASGEEIRPQALLIPCVGFNAQHYRLGYGGGFYDRTLALAPRPLAVGVSYGSGLAEFDADAHDVPLDDVITEDGG